MAAARDSVESLTVRLGVRVLLVGPHWQAAATAIRAIKKNEPVTCAICLLACLRTRKLKIEREEET